jgi:hypothetical protein
MGAELVEPPGGHPQLQDRKLTPWPDRGRGIGGGYSRARTCCPGAALSPALSLHPTSPAELPPHGSSSCRPRGIGVVVRGDTGWLAGGGTPRAPPVQAGDHGRGKCQRQAVELLHARPRFTDPLGESVHAAGWPLPVVLATAARGPGQRANRPHYPRQPRRPEHRVESAASTCRLPR